MANRDYVKKTKNELFIILDYLFNETDEKHLSRTNHIIDYAKKNYGVDIAKSRVGECIKYLKELSEKYPDRVPFAIEDTKELKSKKYYVKNRKLSNEDIYYICASIRDDKYTSASEKDRLTKAVLDLTTNHLNRFEIRIALDKKMKNVSSYSEEVTKRIHILDPLIRTAFIINFDTVSNNALYFKNEKFCESELLIHHRGYVFDVTDYNGAPVLIIVNQASGALDRFDIRRIKHLKVEQPVGSKKSIKNFDITKVYKNETFSSPEEELKEKVMPEKRSMKCTAKFTFDATQNNFDIISNSFKDFFHEDLPYEIKTINNILTAQCTYKTSTFNFLRWCTSISVARIIEITGDAALRKCFVDEYLDMLNKKYKIYEQYKIETIE